MISNHFLLSRLVIHFCHPDRLLAPQVDRIQSDRSAFNFQDALCDTNTTWAAGHAVCFHLCLARRMKGAACFLVTWWPGNTVVCWSKQNADARGVGKRDGEGRGASRWGDVGITSSLPTRQPWVLLLCWSECNRPEFFSLTTGACEHTSLPPWEGRLSWQSQCNASVFLFLFHCPYPLPV